jgi:hypothetical protein
MPETIRTERVTVSIENKEPIRTFSRKAFQNRTSLYANIPVLAREQMGVTARDEISVEVYSDKIVIRRPDNE